MFRVPKNSARQLSQRLFADKRLIIMQGVNNAVTKHLTIKHQLEFEASVPGLIEQQLLPPQARFSTNHFTIDVGIRHSKPLSDEELEKFSIAYALTLNEFIATKMPDLHESLEVIKDRHNYFYQSGRTPHQLAADAVNSVHLNVRQLPPFQLNTANFVHNMVALPILIAENKLAFYQLSEFSKDDAKTARNEAMKRHLMLESLMQQIFPNYPTLSIKQQRLTDDLLAAIRQSNPTELLPIRLTQSCPATVSEKVILSELILPRAKLQAEFLTQKKCPKPMQRRPRSQFIPGSDDPSYGFLIGMFIHNHGLFSSPDDDLLDVHYKSDDKSQPAKIARLRDDNYLASANLIKKLERRSEDQVFRWECEDIMHDLPIKK